LNLRLLLSVRQSAGPSVQRVAEIERYNIRQAHIAMRRALTATPADRISFDDGEIFEIL
jgi:hypothetical protein